MPNCDKEVDRCETCLHYFQGGCLLWQSAGKDNCTHYHRVTMKKKILKGYEVGFRCL